MAPNQQYEAVQPHDQIEDDRLLSDEEDATAEKHHAGHGKEEEHLLKGQSSPEFTKRRDRRFRQDRYQDEVEEGPESSNASTPSSSDLDLPASKDAKPRLRKTKASRWSCCRWTAISLLIATLFVCLLYGAYVASPHTSAGVKFAATTLSNGTHVFQPTTILISLDGFRADFLHRNLTPHLQDLMRTGVSPEYMNPSFPSLTFPNHYTLVTGFHPESHGIVGNNFYDPVAQKSFHHVEPNKSMQPEWWASAQPLWVTAELANVRSAIHMWPGSEAHIGPVEPTYVDKFKMNEKLHVKVQRMLGWLDVPEPEDENANEKSPRPQLIAAYVPDVDTDGHNYGPNSTYIRSTIREVDGMIGSLINGLGARNLTEIVNIVVVSDHGMATVRQVIQYEDLVDPALIEYTDGWPLYGLRPYDETKLASIHAGLLEKSKLEQYKDAFDVYRKEEIPERYHFSNNPRIAPLWIVPRVGYAIAKKDEFDVAASEGNHQDYRPRGLHGYDNEHPLMRSIFVANGPAFPHPQGSRVHPFQNIEVYNIICDSLGIEPAQNNGTIRLPFKTDGLHNFDELAENLPGSDDWYSTTDVELSEEDNHALEDNPEHGENSKNQEEEQDKNALNRFLDWTSDTWQSVKDKWTSLFGHQDHDKDGQ